MYNRKQVLVVNKILADSKIIGLSYKFCDDMAAIHEVSKENFRALFKGCIVLNAKLTSDLRVQHIEGTPQIQVLKRSHTNASPSNSTFPNYPVIYLPNSGVVRLYHGTPRVIKKPKFGYGNKANDYGVGFYCTQEIELAKEWGSRRMDRPGYVCKYKLNLDGLRVLRLESGNSRDILSWICILTDNREVGELGPLQERNLKELHQYFGVPDYSDYDIITGYRADDSYFSCVRSFLNGGVSLEKLSTAFKAGNLGNQVVLKSKKAFDALKYTGFEKIGSPIYNSYFEARDTFARNYFFRGEDRGTTTFYSILEAERRKRGIKG